MSPPSLVTRTSVLKEFDELQEKKIQVNEQFRTILGPQQGAGMNMGNNMGYQGGRPQRYERPRNKRNTIVSFV